MIKGICYFQDLPFNTLSDRLAIADPALSQNDSLTCLYLT